MPKDAQATTYNIRNFDPVTAERHASWLVIGKRRSGKSVTLFDLLSKTADHYDVSFAFAQTKESYEKLTTMVPANKCKQNYTEQAMKKVVHGLRKWHESGKKSQRNSVIILDDCMFVTGIMKSDCMRELYMNARNFFVTSFNCVQYMVDMPPAIRTNVDYVVCMKEPSRDNRKKLYKYFFGVFPTFKLFERTFMRVTRDYGCIVLNNCTSSTDVESCIFKYRADPKVQLRRLGRDVFFDMAAEKKQEAMRQKKEQQHKCKDVERIVISP